MAISAREGTENGVSAETLRANESEALEALFNPDVVDVQRRTKRLYRPTKDLARYPDGRALYVEVPLRGLSGREIELANRRAGEYADAAGTVKGRVRTGTNLTALYVELILLATEPGWEKSFWFDRALIEQAGGRTPQDHVYGRLNPGEIMALGVEVSDLSGFGSDHDLEQAARD